MSGSTEYNSNGWRERRQEGNRPLHFGSLPNMDPGLSRSKIKCLQGVHDTSYFFDTFQWYFLVFLVLPTYVLRM